MVSVFVIIAVIVAAVFIVWYEKYQRQLFIAKVIDGQKVDQKFISQECQLVIEQLKKRQDLKMINYKSVIQLPDGQLLSYRFDDPERMKNTSNLKFEPSPLEWEILRGLVKKVI